MNALWSFCVTVATIAIVLAGCSSGGRNRSSAARPDPLLLSEAEEPPRARITGADAACPPAPSHQGIHDDHPNARPGGAAIFARTIKTLSISGVVPVEFPSGSTDLLAPSQMAGLPDGSMLVNAYEDKKWFVVRMANGMVSSAPIHSTMDVGSVYRLYKLLEGDIFVESENGLFLARIVDRNVCFDPIEGAESVGEIQDVHQLPGIGLLLSNDERKFFLVRRANGKPYLEAIDAAADLVPMYSVQRVSALGIVALTRKGLFRVRQINGKPSFTPVAGTIMNGDRPAQVGELHSIRELANGDVLAKTSEGLFHMRLVGSKAVFNPIEVTAKLQDIHDIYTFSDRRILVLADRRVFQVHLDGGKVRLDRMSGAAHVGNVDNIHELPNGRVLVESERGWFLARTDNSQVSFDVIHGTQAFRSTLTDAYNIYRMQEFSGTEVLIQTHQKLLQPIYAPLDPKNVERKDLDDASIRSTANGACVFDFRCNPPWNDQKFHGDVPSG